MRRATDAQMLEDAERLIAAWNERQTKRMPMLFSPTIGAAITAGYWFLWVRCPACRTINAIDLRTLDRHPDAAVTVIFPRCRVDPVGQTRHLPNWYDSRERASPTKCGKNILVACWANTIPNQYEVTGVRSPAAITVLEFEDVFRLQTVIRLCRPFQRTALLARQSCSRQFFGNCPIRAESRYGTARPCTDKSRRCDLHSTLEDRMKLDRPFERRSPRSASNISSGRQLSAWRLA